jgi:D-alanyl-D-alanine carboxypeptidase (penicillin-binding protein 5/6)
VLHSVDPQRRISTINELLLLAPWATGMKTGHTFKAGYVLVGSGRRKGVELISVVIGAENDETRFEGSLGLLERGFHQYRRRTPVRQGADLADPSIRYSGGELPLRAARTVAAGIRPGQRVAVDVHAPSDVTGPIEPGERLGSALVTVDGLPAGTVALRAGRAIPAASTVDRVRAFPGENPIFTALALFVILIGGVLIWRAAWRRGRTRGS